MTPAARDARILVGAAFVRSAAAALTSVLAAIALRERGFTLPQTGVALAAGLAGAGVATACVSVTADAIGRRRTLITLALLTAGGYLALASAPAFRVLLPLVFVGMVNGMGRDRGAANALEQAVLPGTTAPDRRTWLFAWYNVCLDAGQMVGSAAAAIPGALLIAWAVPTERAYAWMFVACAMALAASALAYTVLSPRIEVTALRHAWRDADQTTRRVLRQLVLLFALDSLGSGFLNSALIAYWFFERFGLSAARIAMLFAAARALNAGSHLLAAWLARRIGLVQTMVATHLPSSVFLMLAPLAPGAAGAMGLFLAREALVEMDVPTRQSYMMAIVPAETRTLVSGVTGVTRLIGWATGPAVAALVMQQVSSSAPLIIGGSLKILYDLLLYRAFRHVKAPEEQAQN
jgi:MFS family permease